MADDLVRMTRLGMERLLRKVLAMKKRPAVVNLHFYAMQRFR